jgi:hypothetical protein
MSSVATKSTLTNPSAVATGLYKISPQYDGKYQHPFEPYLQGIGHRDLANRAGFAYELAGFDVRAE